MTSLTALPRAEYLTDDGSAVIGRWRSDPAHPARLVRLAHIYEDEDEDDPASQFELSDMLELVTIFRETADSYVRQGSYHVAPFSEAEAAHLEQRAQQLLDEEEALISFVHAVFGIKGVKSIVTAYVPELLLHQPFRSDHSQSTGVVNQSDSRIAANPH